MPKQFKKSSPELERLIREQKEDRNGKYVFPERITPRNRVLFNGLTLKQKGTLILSLFMTRKEIAAYQGVCETSVKDQLRLTKEKLSKEDFKRYDGLRVRRRSLLSKR